ncbi:ATP-binding protein [Flavobacterium sp.]|uniref:sensor histidine kinase n=1 Tax=Flavobacterium sp. TaxID=239 RepID=UPI003750C7C2
MKNIEEQRLRILKSYDLLDTKPEVEFDNITFLASTLCNTPISTITLIDADRQWFKSKIGVSNEESSKESSFCSIAIEKSSKTIVVEKVMEDDDFKKVGLINGLTNEGFYAGVPIKDKDTGIILGTLCVIDSVNKTLTERQIISLEILAEQTSKLFELRKKFKSLAQNNEYLLLRYSELEKFASVISHDMKSPLNNIISLIGIIKENASEAINNENEDYFNLIEECSIQLKNYIDGLLNFYKTDSIDLNEKDEIVITDLIEEIKSLLHVNSNVKINFSSDYQLIKTNKYGLIQILLNLVGNGIKYNDKEISEINIDFKSDSNQYIIKVADNGIGMKSENLNEIYESFKILNIKDRFGNYGTGLGLSTVKKIVDKLGSIEVASEINKGTTFTIYLNK